MTPPVVTRCQRGIGWPLSRPVPVACQFTPVFEESGAEHQIILRRAANRKLITVGCTCRRMTIESRARWGAGEAAAAWRAWHEQEEKS
jgi:hypothetical protein